MRPRAGAARRPDGRQAGRGRPSSSRANTHRKSWPWSPFSRRWTRSRSSSRVTGHAAAELATHLAVSSLALLLACSSAQPSGQPSEEQDLVAPVDGPARRRPRSGISASTAPQRRGAPRSVRRRSGTALRSRRARSVAARSSTRRRRSGAPEQSDRRRAPSGLATPERPARMIRRSRADADVPPRRARLRAEAALE